MKIIKTYINGRPIYKGNGIYNPDKNKVRRHIAPIPEQMKKILEKTSNII